MQSQEKERPLWVYRVVLLAATIIWGLGFVIGKYAIAAVGATWFTGIRFLGGGLVMLIPLFPHFKRHINKKVLKAGIIIGFFSFLGFWTQFIGLGWTTPAKNAFLSTCYCLTVPFIWWIIARQKPAKRILKAAPICAIGIGLVSLQGGLSISPGDTMSIVSAFAYGVEIVAISIMMKDNDVLTVTVIQQLTGGVLALGVAMVTQPVPAVELFADPLLIGSLAYVSVLSAAFGAFAQNLAQSRVPAAEASIMLSMESVFCAIFSVIILGEMFTAQMIVGFCLILFAIILSQRQGA